MKIVIEDLNTHDSTTMMVQMATGHDEVSYIEGLAGGLEAWLKRRVNVDNLEGTWYVTLEEAY